MSANKVLIFCLHPAVNACSSIEQVALLEKAFRVTFLHQLSTQLRRARENCFFVTREIVEDRNGEDSAAKSHD